MNYDDWFYDTCEELIKSMNDDSKEEYFTFGHAQKWVNMTMKYLYVIKSIFIKYEPNNVDRFSKLSEELEKKLHVPIDSYILESVSATDRSVTVKRKKEELKCGLGQSLEIPQKTKEGEIKLGRYSNSKGWSKWNKEEYKVVVTNNEKNTLNDILKQNEPNQTPLDWEGAAWIEIAKIRKKRDKK